MSCSLNQTNMYIFKTFTDKLLKPVLYLPKTNVCPMADSLVLLFISLTIHAHTQPSENALFSPQTLFFSLHLPFTSLYIIIPECFYFSFCEITMET